MASTLTLSQINYWYKAPEEDIIATLKRIERDDPHLNNTHLFYLHRLLVRELESRVYVLRRIDADSWKQFIFNPELNWPPVPLSMEDPDYSIKSLEELRNAYRWHCEGTKRARDINKPAWRERLMMIRCAAEKLKAITASESPTSKEVRTVGAAPADTYHHC